MAVTRLRWAPVLGSLIVAAAAPGSPVMSARASVGPERPRILGISHVALRISNLARSRLFYEEFLGFAAVRAATGEEVSATLRVAVGGRQYVEVRAGLRPDQDRLDHSALDTSRVQ